MTRFFAAALALMALFYSSAASAQASVYGGPCVDNTSRRVQRSAFETWGLEKRAELFDRAVAAASRTDEKARSVSVVVVDCPILGHSIRAYRVGGDGAFPSYTIYVTAAYLRNTEEEMLLREARRQACLIRTVVTALERRAIEPQGEETKRCMLQEALMNGDGEYALWLDRTLDGSLSHLSQSRR